MSILPAPNSTTTRPEAAAGAPWNRPLLGLAAVSAVSTVALVVLAAADPEPITGQNGWLKPLKFAISFAIYATTLAWLLRQLTPRRQRLGRLAAIGVVVLSGVEMVVIVGAAVFGTTSHFNVSTPLHATLWGIMGVSIAGVWVLTLLIAIGVFRSPGADRARTLAVRAGLVLALVGMALGFLMTGPTAEQLQNYSGIVGAHTVGAGDGGPGLPLLGWSTVAGDLRIPHFVGMHALQAIPLFTLTLELLAGRVPVLRRTTTRTRLVGVATVAFTGLLGVLTLQALLGQSVVAPNGTVLVLGIVVGGFFVLGSAAVLRRGDRSPHGADVV